MPAGRTDELVAMDASKAAREIFAAVLVAAEESHDPEALPWLCRRLAELAVELQQRAEQQVKAMGRPSSVG